MSEEKTNKIIDEAMADFKNKTGEFDFLEKKIWTTKDFREGKVILKFNGNFTLLKKIFIDCNMINIKAGDIVIGNSYLCHNEEIVLLNGCPGIDVASESEIYLLNTDKKPSDISYKWKRLLTSKSFGWKKITLTSEEAQEIIDDIESINKLD